MPPPGNVPFENLNVARARSPSRGEPTLETRSAEIIELTSFESDGSDSESDIGLNSARQDAEWYKRQISDDGLPPAKRTRFQQSHLLAVEKELAAASPADIPSEVASVDNISSSDNGI
jgi:hypothetical protein